MAKSKANRPVKSKIALAIFSHNGERYERNDYVDADVYGPLAIYEAESGLENRYDIGHVATRFKVAADLKRGDAKKAVRQLLALDWNVTTLKGWIAEERAAMRSEAKAILLRYDATISREIQPVHHRLAEKGF